MGVLICRVDSAAKIAAVCQGTLGADMVEHVAAGHYRVKLAAPCEPSRSVALAGVSGAAAGYAVADVGAESVHVRTFGFDGSPEDCAFSLACWTGA